MDSEEGFPWVVLVAILVGILPILVIQARRIRKWYQKMQSGSTETLEEHVARIEKETKRNDISN